MKAHPRWFAPLTLAATAALFAGCAVISSHEETRFTGRVVAEENLHRIEPGQTTEAWVIATLGEPSRIDEVGDASRLLRYEFTQIKRVDAELLFVFDTSTHTAVDRTIFIECRDGVVTRYWKESGHQRSS